MPRLFCPCSLMPGEPLTLPSGPARHVQVLRLQPGDAVTLFNGEGGEYTATVAEMGRNHVIVMVGALHAIERETLRAVHLAIGMPANERMDWLVEKATELGVASIQPLVTERTVVRLDAERAAKKVAHWQSVAVAAAEQCGRNRVPVVHPVLGLSPWLKQFAAGPAGAHTRLLLSLRAGARPLRHGATEADNAGVTFLCGPEGGLAIAEEDAARAAGFEGVSLGARVLRAETAALAALTLMA